jgi:2-polyprenyl-3-methyl-5-hydroxy-6-metoxy-1,4-benzoquinol methylase
LKLPEKDKITKEEHKRLYEWDTKEYFAEDKKDFWAVFYKNRVEKIINVIERFVPKGKRVLDIGCAQATVSILLAEKGYKVIAGDINPESLQYARLRYEFGDCVFIAINAEKLPFKAKFDVIILGEFLEHVASPDRILQYYGNFLNEDGIIIATTPNGCAPHNWKFKSFTELKSDLEKDRTNIEEFGPEREDHVFNFRFSELKSLFLECEYDVLVSEYLNSYLVNPLNLHKFLPYSIIQKINIGSSKIPVLKKYMSMGLFFVGKKRTEG